MSRINSYLTFNGQCREAMTFYQDSLGGELVLQTVGESPMAGQFPEFMQNLILHSTLAKDDLILMASDLGEEEGLVRGNMVSMSITCDSEAQTYAYYENLSAGGKPTHPVHEFFAGLMGRLTDKYGLNWMFYYDKTGETAD